MAKSWKNRVHSLRGQVFSNWPIKLTALVLAAILWAAVAAQEETTQLVAVELDVQLPEGRALTSDPPPVQALYAGTARELFKLYAQPPMIRKTLPDTITGSQYTMELMLGELVAPDGATVRAQRIEPRFMTVQLDDMVEKVVQVIEQVTIQPDSGYQVFRPLTMTPERVTIRGPQALVESIDSVFTVPLELEQIREPVQRDIPIDTSALGTVGLSPTSVRISVDIGALSERVLMGVPVTVRSERPGQWVSDPSAVLVTVRGRTTRLNALTRDSVQVQAVLDADASDTVVTLQVTPPVDITAWAFPDSVVVRREGSD